MFHLDEVAAFRKGNHTFDDIVAYSSWDVPYVRKTSSELVHGCVLTPNAMDFWGVPPLLGRGFTEQDAQPGAGLVVLLNYNYWKKMFNEDKSRPRNNHDAQGPSSHGYRVMPRRFQLYGAIFIFRLIGTAPNPP